jgi:hypothetical protein
MSTDIQQRSKGFQQWAAQEQKKIDARAAQILAPAQQALREANKEKQRMWRETSPEKWSKASDEYFAVVTPDIPNLETAPEGFFDDAEAATAKGFEAKKVLDTFLKTLPQQRGIVLSLPDQKKFRYLVSAIVRTKDGVITVDNLMRIFDWSVQGETIYQDFGYDADLIVRQSEPDPVPSQDQILRSVDTTTKEGAAMLAAATEQAWLDEHRPLIESWVGHLLSDYNYQPTGDQFRYMFNPIDGLAVRYGLAITGDSLNKIRRMMVAEGRFPQHMLACSEVTDQRYRRGEMTFSEYNVIFQDLSRRGLWNAPRSKAGI